MNCTVRVKAPGWNWNYRSLCLLHTPLLYLLFPLIRKKVYLTLFHINKLNWGAILYKKYIRNSKHV